MRKAMVEHLWSEQDQRFARMATPLSGPVGEPAIPGAVAGYSGKGESPEVTGYRLDMTRDSANYAVFAFGALAPSDRMVRAEMEGLFKRLWVKTGIGGCARYERDYYHMVEWDNVESVLGNPWVICTLWHAQYRIAAATTLEQLKEAVELLEWSADRACASGVLAEQYHPYTGEQISVSPLTWSHATVVTTVVQYLRKHDQLSREAGAGTGMAGAWGVWETAGMA